VASLYLKVTILGVWAISMTPLVKNAHFFSRVSNVDHNFVILQFSAIIFLVRPRSLFCCYPTGGDSRSSSHQGSQSGPVSGQSGQVSDQLGPVSSQSGSVSSQSISVSGQAGPVSSQSGPVSSQSGPVSSQSGPVRSQSGPVSSQLGPVSGPLGPVSSQLDPVSGQFGPVSGQSGPVSSQLESELFPPPLPRTRLSFSNLAAANNPHSAAAIRAGNRMINDNNKRYDKLHKWVPL
jgi:hypothetical protein